MDGQAYAMMIPIAKEIMELRVNAIVIQIQWDISFAQVCQVKNHPALIIKLHIIKAILPIAIHLKFLIKLMEIA